MELGVHLAKVVKDQGTGRSKGREGKYEGEKEGGKEGRRRDKQLGEHFVEGPSEEGVQKTPVLEG